MNDLSARGLDWWDNYYMGLAKYVSRASRDPTSQCGAVIVRPDKTIASTGFNGFPKGMPDDPALYADRDEKLDRVIHAEINALSFKREPVDGYTMYIQPYLPCTRCAVQVIQNGIARVVAPPLDTLPDRWQESMRKAVGYLLQAGVEVSEHVGFH